MRRRGDHGRRLTSADRLEIQRRVRAGEEFAAAALAVGCSAKSVQRLLNATGGLAPRTRARSALRLSLSEREEISRGLLTGDSSRRIAARLRRSPSTVSREVSANGARRRYRAWRAESAAERHARRPKSAKLACSRRLRTEVERLLDERWCHSRSRVGSGWIILTIRRCG